VLSLGSLRLLLRVKAMLLVVHGDLQPATKLLLESLLNDRPGGVNDVSWLLGTDLSSRPSLYSIAVRTLKSGGTVAKTSSI